MITRNDFTRNLSPSTQRPRKHVVTVALHFEKPVEVDSDKIDDARFMSEVEEELIAQIKTHIYGDLKQAVYKAHGLVIGAVSTHDATALNQAFDEIIHLIDKGFTRGRDPGRLPS